MTISSARPRFAPAHIAGILLLFAGAATLMGIITAEAVYPDVYTTHANTISDLAVPLVPDGDAQPSAAIFNGVMIATGAMQVAAAMFLHRAFRSWRVTIPVALLGIGSMGVGFFPSDFKQLHFVAATTVFVSGGVAAIASAHVQRGPFRIVSMLLGAVVFAGLGALGLAASTDAFTSMGDGGIERWVAYPIVIWTIAFGAYLTALDRDGRHGSAR